MYKRRFALPKPILTQTQNLSLLIKLLYTMPLQHMPKNHLKTTVNQVSREQMSILSLHPHVSNDLYIAYLWHENIHFASLEQFAVNNYVRRASLARQSIK